MEIKIDKINIEKKEGKYIIECKSKDYKEYLILRGYNWGSTIYNKIIPSFITNQNIYNIYIFLTNIINNKIMEKDGKIYLFVSIKIAYQLNYLFLMFNIITNINKNDKNNNCIIIINIGIDDFRNINLIKTNNIITLSKWNTNHKIGTSQGGAEPLPGSYERAPLFDSSTKGTRVKKEPGSFIFKGPLTPGEPFHTSWIGSANPEIVKNFYFVKISNVQYKKCNDYVYDFETSIYHNYIANGIICHNTCGAIAIAEKFKPMIQKYNQKIYVLVPGPLIKENWKKELINCTNETYYATIDKTLINTTNKSKLQSIAINHALQYYKFISYRSFYKKVLGDKIIIKSANKKKHKYQRDISVDKIVILIIH